MNRTIVEMARTLLTDADLPNRYLKNTLTPHEAYTGNKPSVAHLRIFGCKAWVILNTKRPIYSFIVRVGALWNPGTSISTKANL